MAEIEVSAEARADILDIHTQSTVRFGLDTADQYIDDMNASITRLAEFPLSGPVYSGLRPPVRFLAYRRHHIFYDYDGETVWIVRIVHHARDVRHLT